MKNLLTVLKKLGKKMTSQDINGTNLVTVVDDIANKYTGGSGGGGEGGCDCTMVVGVTADEQTRTLDKTWQEIHDALVAGKRVIIQESASQEVILNAYVDEDLDDPSYVTAYMVSSYSIGISAHSSWITDSATGYPYSNSPK